MKNSSNSNKPLSSDGYRKPSPKSLCQRHKKKIGGQPGHTGKTLQMVSEPDRVEVYGVSRCRHYQASLEQVAVEGVEKRQVFDILPVKQALCNTHLLRELVFVKGQYHLTWAVKMIDLLL